MGAGRRPPARTARLDQGRCPVRGRGRRDRPRGGRSGERARPSDRDRRAATGVQTLMGDLVYFSVDVEASGPVPGLYNLVSIGVVPVGRYEGIWRPEDERFYVELKPISGGFDREAMA